MIFTKKEQKMNRLILLLSLILICVFSAIGQQFTTQNGYIRFFSNAPLEDIEAENNKVRVAVDLSTGEVAFMLTIKDFIFNKSLMQQHFNENYMESDKYPSASFNGTINGHVPEMFEKNGEYPITVSGKLTIHGVEKEIEVEGKLGVNDNIVKVNTVFVVQTADFKIKIPKIMFARIAEEIEVTVDAKLEGK